MLGLGLAALDVERAKDCLNQYLLPEDDPYAAFVEHGTPLPIQAELPMEIWQRATDREWLAEMLPSYATSTSGSGYWNGAVWMPHNVMIWKALREQGKVEQAQKLATALLNTWDRETRASYHCFELFRADTGRGAGWHQFSGLSAPLLMIYSD